MSVKNGANKNCNTNIIIDINTTKLNCISHKIQIKNTTAASIPYKQAIVNNETPNKPFFTIKITSFKIHKSNN